MSVVVGERINFNNPMANKPANLQHSAVLRFLEEEENRKRGISPSIANNTKPPLICKSYNWPPSRDNIRRHRTSFPRGKISGLKRVAWPPAAEAEGHLSEISLQDLGGPQISSPGLQNNQAPSANYQQQGQERPQLSNQHHPVVASSYKPTHQVAPQSPSYHPIPLSPSISCNVSPAGFSPVQSAKHWAPVQSPVAVSPQPKFPSGPQQYQPPPQQYQPPPQQYQPPSPQQYQPPSPQPYQPQQYQPPPQQYQPAPQQYQPPPQQYQPPPQQYQPQDYQQYQPPPQQYQPPPQQYQPPPQQYQPPPQQYQPPPQQYQPPPQQYQPPPQQYQPPPQQYQPPPQQYQPPPQPAKPIQQTQTTQTYSQPSTPQQPIAQPQFQATATVQPQLAQQQQQHQPQVQAPPPQQYQRPGVAPQPRPQPVAAQPPQPQQTAKPAKFVEPPPATITLRPEAPVSQAPAPLITSQPATATLKGGKNLRGDLKWPPPETKATMEEENRKRMELARGPVCRPRKVHKDYTGFFAQHALNSSYPGYKIPPGTQFYVHEQ